jgi:serine/threonine protein kinase
MDPVRTFLQCIAEPIVKRGAQALTRPLTEGTFLHDLAASTMKRLRARLTQEQLPAAIEAVAQCPRLSLQDHVGGVVHALAAELPASEQRTLTLFLLQMPVSIRQALKRPDDPAGISVPHGLSLRSADDLLPFLPRRLPMFQSGEPPPGDDKWVLRDLLGVGGFGEVWKAQHRDYPTMFAAFKFCTDPTARRRLLAHEGKVVSQVMSQGRVRGIVPLLDADIHADPPWLRYEYIEGGDLAGVLRAWMQSPRRNRVELATRIVMRLATIVGHFHRASPPVIHRDLKPANILVQNLGAHKIDLRVADFGIGDIAAQRELDQASVQTATNMSLPTAVRRAHTPRYASPQQKAGEPPDVRDDVYALGVIWYQLFVQDLGQELPSGLELADDLKALGVSEPLVRLLGECVSSKPDKRPADAATLAERLRRVLKPEADEPELIDDDPVPGVTVRAATPSTPAETPAPVARPASSVKVARPVTTAPPRSQKSTAIPARAPTRAEQAPAPPRKIGSVLTIGCLAVLGVAALAAPFIAIFHRDLLGLVARNPPKKDGPAAPPSGDNKDAPDDSKNIDTGSPRDNGIPNDPANPPTQTKVVQLAGTWTARFRKGAVEQGQLTVVFDGSQMRISDESLQSPLVAQYQLQPVMVKKFQATEGVRFNYEAMLLVKGSPENPVDFEVPGHNRMILYCPEREPDFPDACRGLTIEFTR